MTEEDIEKETAAESEEEQSESKAAAFIKKAFSLLTTLILVGSLGILVYVTVSAARGKIVSIFGHTVLTVVTGSMEPSLHVGDYIFIERTDPAQLKEGDIISFYSEQSDIFGLLVTHRIAKVNEDGTFVTRGDANPVDDSVTVRPERIVGKYTGKARLFRWASSFGDLRKLALAAVMVMTTIAAFYEVLTIGRLKTRLDAEKQSKEEERERLIREAIEAEKARLAAEGFGQDKPPESVDKPAETVDKPEESGDKPAETVDKPAETVDKLTETVDKPAETVDKPTETVDKPTETVDKPTETDDKPEPVRPEPKIRRKAPRNLWRDGKRGGRMPADGAKKGGGQRRRIT